MDIEEHKQRHVELHRMLDELIADWIANTVKEFSSKLPKEFGPIGNGNTKVIEEGVDRIVAFQKEYVNTITSISDKLTKVTKDLTHKNIEKAFSLFDYYPNAFRV